MSDSIQELIAFILRDRRIIGKAVVLCEGDRQPRHERPSPQSYRRHETMPDANFYKKCIPASYDRFPSFFNCGGRSEVLQVYFGLLAEQSLSPSDYYLDPAKLYALVDADLQPQSISDYPFASTEDIFDRLYGLNANPKPFSFPIWVTGWRHKEAYFLDPRLEATLKGQLCGGGILFQGKSLDFNDICKFLLDQLSKTEFDDFLNIALKRLNNDPHLRNLQAQNAVDLQNALKQRASQLSYQELLPALLSITRAKDAWKEISPQDPLANLDSLVPELAMAISLLEPAQAQDHHLRIFIEALYR